MERPVEPQRPSGEQLPQRCRWSRMSTREHSPRPSLGHQRSTLTGNRSAARLGTIGPPRGESIRSARRRPCSRDYDTEAPVIEADLRPAHVASRDDHSDIPAQVRQRLAADEPLRCSLQHRLRRMAEDPGRPLPDNGPQLAVRRSRGGGDPHPAAVHCDLDRLPAPRATAYLVLDGRVAEANAVPAGHCPLLLRATSTIRLASSSNSSSV